MLDYGNSLRASMENVSQILVFLNKNEKGNWKIYKNLCIFSIIHNFVHLELFKIYNWSILSRRTKTVVSKSKYTSTNASHFSLTYQLPLTCRKRDRVYSSTPTISNPSWVTTINIIGDDNGDNSCEGLCNLEIVNIWTKTSSRFL